VEPHPEIVDPGAGLALTKEMVTGPRWTVGVTAVGSIVGVVGVLPGEPQATVRVTANIRPTTVADVLAKKERP
jgi:hypothetical protein